MSESAQRTKETIAVSKRLIESNKKGLESGPRAENRTRVQGFDQANIKATADEKMKRALANATKGEAKGKATQSANLLNNPRTKAARGNQYVPSTDQYVPSQLVAGLSVETGTGKYIHDVYSCETTHAQKIINPNLKCNDCSGNTQDAGNSANYFPMDFHPSTSATKGMSHSGSESDNPAAYSYREDAATLQDSSGEKRKVLNPDDNAKSRLQLDAGVQAVKDAKKELKDMKLKTEQMSKERVKIDGHKLALQTQLDTDEKAVNNAKEEMKVIKLKNEQTNTDKQRLEAELKEQENMLIAGTQQVRDIRTKVDANKEEVKSIERVQELCKELDATHKEHQEKCNKLYKMVQDVATDARTKALTDESTEVSLVMLNHVLSTAKADSSPEDKALVKKFWTMQATEGIKRFPDWLKEQEQNSTGGGDGGSSAP